MTVVFPTEATDPAHRLDQDIRLVDRFDGFGFERVHDA
jgi:hypothetical protein